jgi:predicted transcriptional regulator YdeE
MKKEIVDKPEMTIVGLKTRTSNVAEFDPKTARIGPILGEYFQENFPEKIENRKNPGVTLSIFTQYESDHQGEYMYYLGEEVSAAENLSSSLETMTIPAQKYVKFTTNSGAMPDIEISAWRKIWEMSSSDFDGQRSYIADFTVYDQRAQDLSNAVVDIYIGIKK